MFGSWMFCPSTNAASAYLGFDFCVFLDLLKCGSEVFSSTISLSWLGLSSSGDAWCTLVCHGFFCLFGVSFLSFSPSIDSSYGASLSLDSFCHPWSAHQVASLTFPWSPLSREVPLLVRKIVKTLHRTPHLLRYNNVLLLGHNVSVPLFHGHSPQRCNESSFCRTCFASGLVRRHNTHTQRLWNGLPCTWYFMTFDMEKWAQALLVVVYLWHTPESSCTQPRNVVAQS